MAATRTGERPLVVALASLPPGDPGPLLAGAFRAGAGEVRAPRPGPATLRALGALEERGAIEVRSNGFPGGEVVIVPGPAAGAAPLGLRSSARTPGVGNRTGAAPRGPG